MIPTFWLGRYVLHHHLVPSPGVDSSPEAPQASSVDVDEPRQRERGRWRTFAIDVAEARGRRSAASAQQRPRRITACRKPCGGCSPQRWLCAAVQHQEVKRSADQFKLWPLDGARLATQHQPYKSAAPGRRRPSFRRLDASTRRRQPCGLRCSPCSRTVSLPRTR